jgi:two-component system, NarL family, capsular synthesis sensor histidine kinase RcsC
MERLVGSRASPLAALKALDRNLKRERRMFAMLIALLAFAALSAAAVAIFAISFVSLRTQTAQLATLSARTDELLARRNGLLIGARVLLALAETSPTDPYSAKPAPRPCEPTFEGLPGSPVLRDTCSLAEQFASSVSSDTPLMIVSMDGAAAYGYQLGPKAQPATGEAPSPAGNARLLVDTALLHLSAQDLDSPTTGRRRSPVWFRPPDTLGFDSNLILGANVVFGGDKPTVLVMTSIDLDTLGATAAARGLPVEPSLIAADGTPLDGPLAPGAARLLDYRIASLPSEHFHLLWRYGWVLRSRPLAAGFGHYLLAVPWVEFVRQIRTPLEIVLAMTCGLLAMLVGLALYWSRHVLARTYADATRALEGELLNHLLVHATPVGLCIVRQRNFEIVVANQIVRNLLGLDEQAARLPNALCAEFETRWSDDAKAGPATDGNGEPRIFDLPFSLPRSDGQRIHLDITYAAATMNREPVMFCAMTDMSKHYEAEQLLRDAKRTSDEAAQAKVSLFAAMSHEIRTPLASLVGNIELVARGPLAPEQDARVKAMEISASELRQIVNDVLDFSKIDVGQMRLSETSASITQLLERIALSHAALAVRQGLSFYLVIDRAIPARLIFDPVRVAQIVNNLLSNAFKFTHSGKIVLRANWRTDKLEIGIADSGVGIPESLKPRLFQPFTQGDGQRLTQARGTGLGLSICARLTALMRGNTDLQSTLGIGTRVTVTLPLKTDGTQTAGETWTLPDAHPAILCRAPENREWLTGLFDARVSTPTFIESDEPPRDGSFDYLLATDEFAPDEVIRRWGGTANIVWLRQDGPLLPTVRDETGVVVSLYSLTGIRDATGMLRGRRPEPVPREEPDTGGNDEARPAAYEHLQVLIAEDNVLNRGLLRDQLRTLGAQVIEAKDGEEALARLGEQRVDLLLTDLNMPVMNGYELLQAARARYPGLPVYAVSSNALPEQIEEGRTKGFADYLSKPVALAELARVLNAAGCSADAEARGEAAEPPRFPALPPAFAALFVEQADHDIADYESLARARDFKRLRDWAHRVTGGIAVLGPSMLYEACLELRATMREAGQWTDEVGALSAAIVDELTEMRSLAVPRESN